MHKNPGVCILSLTLKDQVKLRKPLKVSLALTPSVHFAIVSAFDIMTTGRVKVSVTKGKVLFDSLRCPVFNNVVGTTPDKACTMLVATT